MDSNKSEGGLNKNLNSTEKLDSLSLFLFPESLENSKALPILSDTSFNFKINDLLQIKEVSKICTPKEELVILLSQMAFIKLADDRESANVTIDENLVVFSFVNIPQKMKKEEILEKFGLSSENVVRLYKKSLFWILVLLKDSSEDLEKRFSQVDFGDGVIKYEVTNKSQLVKNINKQIQICNYHKEAHNLKVDPGKKAAQNGHSANGNGNFNSNNKDRRNSEAFSWRKKSGEGMMNSPEDGKNSNFNSNYNSNNSNYKFPLNKNSERSFKRERFNSEGNNPSKFSIAQSKYNSADRFEEIEIDVTNLKYSLNIKNKYSMQEMLHHFDVLNQKKLFDAKPTFNKQIDEIICEKRKDFHIVAKGRDRANTSYTFNNDPKNMMKKGYDSNPSNEKRLSFNYESNSGMKIPMNNPLGNIGKTFGNFNKFDDPNLNLNPVHMAFNAVKLGDSSDKKDSKDYNQNQNLKK